MGRLTTPNRQPAAIEGGEPETDRLGAIGKIARCHAGKNPAEGKEQTSRSEPGLALRIG